MTDYKRRFKRYIKFREDGYVMKKMKEIPHQVDEFFEKIHNKCCMEMATYCGYYFCKLLCCPCYTCLIVSAFTYANMKEESFPEEEKETFDFRSDY